MLVTPRIGPRTNLMNIVLPDGQVELSIGKFAGKRVDEFFICGQTCVYSIPYMQRAVKVYGGFEGNPEAVAKKVAMKLNGGEVLSLIKKAQGLHIPIETACVGHFIQHYGFVTRFGDLYVKGFGDRWPTPSESWVEPSFPYKIFR